MSTFPNTGATQLVNGQATPETAVNEIGYHLDAGHTRSIVEDRDLATPPGSCADGARYLIAASPTGAWASKAGKLAIAVGANASNGWLFQTVTMEGFKLYVRDENVEICHDGSAWNNQASPIRLISFFFTSTPTASEILGIYVAADAFTIPANMSGSRISVGTNPTSATFDIDVQKNGVSIGTISISTAGAVTLSTTSGSAKAIASGDVITFIADASIDTTISNVAVTVKGA